MPAPTAAFAPSLRARSAGFRLAGVILACPDLAIAGSHGNCDATNGDERFSAAAIRATPGTAFA